MRHIDSLGMPRSAIHEVGIAVARKLRRPLQLVSALAFACIYGSSTAGVIAINGVGALYNVSTTDATLSLIGNTGIADWGDIQFAPNGTLYGFTTGGSAALYRINPATAAATLIGSLGLGFVFEGGLAFSPSGTAYGTNGGAATNAQLFTLNLATGAASIIGTISGGSHDINGLTWRSDGVLIGLDDLTNALLLINPLTATSSSLAPVSSPVGAVGGMTQTGGLGYFATDTSPSSSVFSGNLLSFNLSSGAQTLIGSFQTNIVGLAATPSAVPEPATLALLGFGLAGLGLARRRSRGLRAAGV